MLIDTHSHVYLSEFGVDAKEMLERARSESIKHILLPNIDSSTIDSLKKLCESNDIIFKGMMGLHPGSVKEDFEKELQTIKNELYSGKYIAVGEIGIDLYWDKTFLKEQIIAFKEQIAWALDLNLPIVIHARDSFYEIFEVLEEYKDTQLRGVFHCFSGGPDELERALSFSNFMIGIGGVLTFKNSGLDKTIVNASLDRLVLETDAPYLSPVPHRGKRNEPAYIRFVANKLAEIKGEDVALIEKVTSENASRLFNISINE